MTKSVAKGNEVATVESVTQVEGLAPSYSSQSYDSPSYNLSDYLSEASYHTDSGSSYAASSLDSYQVVSHEGLVNEAAPDLLIPSLDMISAFCTVALLCYLLYREYLSERVGMCGRAWIGSDSIIKRSLLNQEPCFRAACFRGGSLS